MLQVVITKLKLDKDRKNILDRKAKGKQQKMDKGKYQEETMETQQIEQQ